MEVYADMETPISLFKRFEDSGYCFLLESVEGGEKWARFSFMGRNPFLTLKGSRDKTVVSMKDGNPREFAGNPMEALREVMKEYRGVQLDAMPRFNGGAVGYFGYDIVRCFEKLPDIPRDDLGLPEGHFMLADEVIAFDHLRQKIKIIVNLHVGDNLERGYCSVVERIRRIYGEIRQSRWKTENNVKTGYDNTNPAKTSGPAFECNMTKDEFCGGVVRAKEYIRNGDIFQVVLSQRFSTDTLCDPFNVYRALRVINPSPYMYYLKFDNYRLAGSSPEMLVRVENGIVETCPIAGTRKRGSNPEEDTRLEMELLADEKERAEHIMLVDLGRNDVGKISKFGTVKVRDIMHVERYSHVMHLVSNVQGELREDKTPFDALASLLPAGTLSGAPKVRAMEIIDELEKTKRGPYAGAVGYLGFNGNIDSCITIRTIIFKDGKAYVQVGAGIVADSVPELEYEETQNKGRALFRALEEAGGIT